MMPRLVAMAQYYFANESSLYWVLLAWLVFLLITILSYRHSPLPLVHKVIAIGARAIGIGLLLFCLLEPMVRYEVAKPQANSFALLLDKSQSVSSNWGDKTKADSLFIQDHWLAENIKDNAPWVQGLSKNFQLRRYLFGADLDSVDSYEAVSLDATESALMRSLQTLKNRLPNAWTSSEPVNAKDGGVHLKGTPLAGILLFSDGQATDRSRLEQFESYPVPIYPVIKGDKNLDPDIAISEVGTSVSDFETSPVTIYCTLRHRGFDNQEVVVVLNGSDSKPIEEKKIRLKPYHHATRVEFRFRPKEFGVQGYQIQVHSNRGENGKSSLVQREVTLHNNSRYQVVERKRGPHRVLYISGRPNWEYKFLSRAIHEDEEIELDTLIRIARKEAKFSFRDGSANSSNALFSGFDDISDEEKEQHDEPVFVRIDSAASNAESNRMTTKSATERSMEAKDGVGKGGRKFPSDLKSLFQYKTIVLDDFDEELLTREQQMMLQQFVRARGGGLLALGGAESMRGSQFNSSPLGALIPVYGERTADIQESSQTQFIYPDDPRFGGTFTDQLTGQFTGGADHLGPTGGIDQDESDATRFATNINNAPVTELKFDLTREGWLQPFMRLADSEAGEKTRLEAAPKIQVWNRVAGVKPGAQVLAVGEFVDGESSPDMRNSSVEQSVPLLVTQRFGRGRSAAFLAGDWWRWAMSRTGNESPMLYQSWRQIVRWTMTDVPDPIEFTSLPVGEASHARKLQLDLRNHLFEPLDDAEVEIIVTNPKGEHQTIQADLSPEVTGRYEAVVLCEAEGFYFASARYKSPEEDLEGKLETGWAYEPLLNEFEGVGEDVEFLSSLAKKSGGRVVRWEELPGFTEALIQSDVPIKESIVFPLWHQAWVLLLAVTCFCVEWGWRRRYGMA